METSSAEDLLLYEASFDSSSRIPLERLERACVDRQDLLRLLQVAGEQHQHDACLRLLERWETLQDPETDVASHMVMRLCFCHDQEDSSWFVRQEVELLRMRLSLHFDERSSVRLMEHIGWGSSLVEDEHHGVYYEIPFEHVPELVARRKTTLHKGMARVGIHQLYSPVADHFRRELERGLRAYGLARASILASSPALKEVILILEERSRHGLDEVIRHSRFRDEVESLDIRLDQDNAPSCGKWSQTSLMRLDEIAWMSFPMCAHRMLRHLRQTHHAKFQARFQLTLFLKGAGFPVDAAIAFWKSEIDKGEMKDFKREFTYSVRHSYGLEGSRVNYTPHSCHSLLEKSPGHNDCHGCPFRVDSLEGIRAEMVSFGIREASVDRIVDLVRRHRYRQACAEVFRERYRRNLTGFSTDEEGTHSPLQYFSQALEELGFNLSLNGEDFEAGIFAARNRLETLSQMESSYQS